MAIELKVKAAIEKVAGIAIDSSLVLGTKQNWSEILSTFSETIYNCGYSVEYGAGLIGIRVFVRNPRIVLIDSCKPLLLW